MANNSGQKFISKNRAPRVQVEYDVELYGAEKKVSLPFVMAVMSDLSGNRKEPLPRVEERNFVEIDAENFDERLKTMAPRVTFQVPNVMNDEGGNLSVELNFESMEDFAPDKVAEKVDGVKELLEARRQLSNLLSYMDGKTGAEDLITRLLEDESLLKALASKPNNSAESAEPKSDEAQ